jgi:hypothetical protein
LWFERLSDGASAPGTGGIDSDLRNLRNPAGLLSIAIFTLLGAIAVSCGGSSNPGGNGGPYIVAGDWRANFSPEIGNTVSAVGAINSAGLGALFDTSGNIVQLPIITGATSFSGNLITYALNGSPFAGGTYIITETAQGNVSSATSITGTFTGSSAGSFSVSPFSPVSGSVVPVSGTMNGKITGFSDTLLLTFSSDGTFTGGDFAGPGSTCNVNGKLTQDGTNNVFDVTYNNASGSCFTDTQTGIAFESATDYFNVNGGADANYLYMVLLTSTLTQVRPYVIILYK